MPLSGKENLLRHARIWPTTSYSLFQTYRSANEYVAALTGLLQITSRRSESPHGFSQSAIAFSSAVVPGAAPTVTDRAAQQESHQPGISTHPSSSGL